MSQSGFIKFLGTAGARFVMIKQLRASGGIWVSASGTNVLIDPGPGSIVQCVKSCPKLDPTSLDAVILTHRHLDHCSDVNVIIEAITEGGFKKRGTLFCPQDAIASDPVVLEYSRSLLRAVEILRKNSTYKVGDFVFQTSMPHIHPVETYGLKFNIGETTVSLLTDTGYFPELKDFYATDVLVISVVFRQARPGIKHLSVEDVKQIVAQTKPKKVILTHFGMGMVKVGPDVLAQGLAKELNTDIVAASDGMMLRL